MLFMFVCAVGSAWVGSKLESTRREQVVVAEIESVAKIGTWAGWVEYYEMVGPPWITRHFRRAEAVYLGATDVTDAGLVYLKGLTRIK